MNSTEEIKKTGILSEEQSDNISRFELSKPLSIHWELRVILYLGVTLLSTGLGILVYKNIDTIGHISIIAAIAIACVACIAYCFKNRLPYTNTEVKYASPFFDYILLLGCLLFGILVGYLQYQYEIFGTRYGLATAVPTLLYIACAYLFDHKGVLSLGITGVCAWAGISVTPLNVLDYGWDGDELYYTGMILGTCLGAAAWFSETKKIKPHFGFTINNFAATVFFVSCLSALFIESMIWLLGIAGAVYWYIRYARERKSLLFLLYSVIYGYIAFTYLVLETFFNNVNSDAEITFLMFYFMASAAGVIIFFIKYKKILGIKDDRVQQK